LARSVSQAGIEELVGLPPKMDAKLAREEGSLELDEEPSAILESTFKLLYSASSKSTWACWAGVVAALMAWLKRELKSAELLPTASAKELKSLVKAFETGFVGEIELINNLLSLLFLTDSFFIPEVE
jgi:hypothetical protein